MLFTPVNDFGFIVDNFGSTYTDAALGVSCPSNASANVKSADVNLLNGIAEDCYAIAICFVGSTAAATIRRSLVDILVDPAAGVGNSGSTWSVLIPNLLVFNPVLNLGGGVWYYFPLYVKAGTAIGAAHQCVTAVAQPLRIAVRLFGKPSHPELCKAGSYVESFGVVLGTTSGTGITPGTGGAMGSYTASLGTSTENLWWWQCGFGYNDVSLTSDEILWFDVAAGDATNKQLCLQNVQWSCFTGTGDQGGMVALGANLPYKNIPSGSDIYMRSISIGVGVSTTPQVCAYGVGG